MTGVLAALARRTPSRLSSRPGIWGLREAVPHAGCRAQPVTSDEVSAAARGTGWRAGAGQPSALLGLPTLGKCGESREGSKDTEGGGGDGKKPRSSSEDRPSQGWGAGAEVRPGRYPGPAAPQPHGADSVPRPKGARSRKSRPHADVTLAADAGRGQRPLEGGDELPEAGAVADDRGNARPGRRPERPLWVAKIPRGERNAQSGAGTCFREPEWSAQLSGKPRSLVSSPRSSSRPFFQLPACALGPALHTLFSCLRARVVVLAPLPPAFVPYRVFRSRCLTSAVGPPPTSGEPAQPARRKRPGQNPGPGASPPRRPLHISERVTTSSSGPTGVPLWTVCL